ncbi:SDR family oxidoreductase [Aridibaculum aurantiacum]|uniref:SDR family oxidoreductase n=1 Tax=Aridibaculum aurantiacum TaxID=2810307 RepID=UPI001A95DF02|nr:SDR family oxidoreductase [Aridibaculum aurantiacum]
MSNKEDQNYHDKIDEAANSEKDMTPRPVYEREYDLQPKKLQDKVAIITGGDSGIGRAVAIHFAREGADVVIVYYKEKQDADETQKLVEEKGRKALVIQADVSVEENCRNIVQQTIDTFGKLDILVNNAAIQFPKEDLQEITEQQWDETFRTNIYSYFFMSKAALPHLKAGAAIVNNASVNAYRGNKELVDYSSTKGAIVAFTRSLSTQLAEKNIRVNGVAPGPIWTPLIPSTFPGQELEDFGSDTPMKRAGQPAEVASCFVFLASDDASYITGQFLHPNGGTVLNT